MVYIYALMDPVLNVPRYVGKAANPRERFGEHLSESKCGQDNNSHKCNWIRMLFAKGLSPILRVLQKIPKGYEETWQEAEIKWIKLFRLMGYPLTNATDGGDGIEGYVHTEETRQHHSEFMMGKQYAKGMKHTEEWKQEKSRSMKEFWTPERIVWVTERMMGNTIRRGSTMPDDSKRRIGIASQRFWDGVEEGLHPHPTKGKKNLGVKRAGKRRMGEKRPYHSEVMKGKQLGGIPGTKHSIEAKQNMSKGRRFSILRKQGIIPDLVDFATNVFNLEPETKQGWARFVQLHM